MNPMPLREHATTKNPGTTVGALRAAPGGNAVATDFAIPATA